MGGGLSPLVYLSLFRGTCHVRRDGTELHLNHLHLSNSGLSPLQLESGAIASSSQLIKSVKFRAVLQTFAAGGNLQCAAIRRAQGSGMEITS